MFTPKKAIAGGIIYFCRSFIGPRHKKCSPIINILVHNNCPMSLKQIKDQTNVSVKKEKTLVLKLNIGQLAMLTSYIGYIVQNAESL